MSLPNILTLSRIVLAGFIVLLLLNNTLTGTLLATVLFIIAAVTDFYDGHLAKTKGLVTDFGKIMDPIADKVLILSVLAVLSYLGMVATWMVVVIAAREVAVTVSRLMAMSNGRVFAAEAAGKVKTVLQMVTISLALLFLIADQSAAAHDWFYKVQMPWLALIEVCMIGSVALTVISGDLVFYKVPVLMSVLARLIATVLGVGYFPAGPGTAATAAGIVLIWKLQDSPFCVYCAVLAVLFAAGVISAGYVEKVLNEKDPGIVVIDEVVGVMIGLMGIPLSWPTAICGFFLFRAFDMFKIYPINRFEAMPGGWGIMLDDVMAGLYTNIVLAIAVRWAGII